jgi:hypothetical protein
MRDDPGPASRKICGVFIARIDATGGHVVDSHLRGIAIVAAHNEEEAEEVIADMGSFAEEERRPGSEPVGIISIEQSHGLQTRDRTPKIIEWLADLN